MSFEGAGPANNINLAAPSQPAVATPSEQVPSPPTPAPEQNPPQIEDFDDFIKGDVQAFVDFGKHIGDLVGEQVVDSSISIVILSTNYYFQAEAVLQAFQAERTFLLVTTKAKKPDQLAPELMTELHKASDSINNIRESHRSSPFFDHLSAVSEGIVALGWFFEPKPATFVNDMVGGIQYYGNKVLKQYKDK